MYININKTKTKVTRFQQNWDNPQDDQLARLHYHPGVATAGGHQVGVAHCLLFRQLHLACP